VADSLGIEPLDDSHDTGGFDCGKPELNRWLEKYALLNQRTGVSRTLVLCRDQKVLGFYALAPGSVQLVDAPPPLAEDMGNFPVPVVILARLAVDVHEQGRGYGAVLLRDAMVRAARGAEAVGGRALLVHAKDEEAASFYAHFGFEPSPTDALHLFLPMDALIRWLREAGLHH
jgi:GNAT superfamily N-acetyltransferase